MWRATGRIWLQNKGGVLDIQNIFNPNSLAGGIGAVSRSKTNVSGMGGKKGERWKDEIRG